MWLSCCAWIWSTAIFYGIEQDFWTNCEKCTRRTGKISVMKLIQLLSALMVAGLSAGFSCCWYFDSWCAPKRGNRAGKYCWTQRWLQWTASCLRNHSGCWVLRANQWWNQRHQNWTLLSLTQDHWWADQNPVFCGCMRELYKLKKGVVNFNLTFCFCFVFCIMFQEIL